MTFWLLLTVNSITFGGLLFLLAAGFSLIFGLMRIPNLTHGSLFMLGAYFGATFVGGYSSMTFNFWVAVLLAIVLVAAFGALIERFLLRQLPGQPLAQVLVTLGVSFIVADFCLMVWGGDPVRVATPDSLTGFVRYGPLVFPHYRLAIIVIAVIVALGLWLLLDRTRLGAMIRAGVDDPDMARVVGIRVSRLFTIVFALGAGLAAFGGIIGAPILSVYPGLDQDMLPLALVVVILGGSGSLLGVSSAAWSSASSIISARRCCPSFPISYCSCPCCWCCCCVRKGCSAGSCHENPAMSTRLIAIAAGLLALVTLPFWMHGDYYVNVSSQILFSAIFALGLNILAGYGGLVSLGHAGLFGIAAYATGYMLQAGFGHTVAILTALTVGMAAMAVFAVLSLRATGIGFIMITLAVGEIIWGLAYRWISITGGDNGINVHGRPHPFGFEIDSPGAFYYTTLVVFLVAFASVAVFVRSPMGAALMGTRDQPRRMNALGYHVWAIRFWACMFSGLLTAIAGVLFVYYTQFISPQALDLTSSAEVLLMVISGGAGTLLGPIVGAALVVVVKSVVSGFIERWNMLLGFIFVAIVILMPEGLVPGSARLWRLAWRKLSAPGKAAATEGKP